MKLQRREKILACVTGGLIVVVIGWFLFSAGDGRSVAQLIVARDDLTEKVAEKQKLVDDAHRYAKRLAEWQRRAVPVNPDVYQNWLRSLADEAGIKPLNLKLDATAASRNAYTCFKFTLTGHVSLSKLTEFLYGFYSAGHLHLIRRLTIKPVENGKELDVGMAIEAMSLPGVDRKELTNEPGHGLKLAKVSEYQDAVAKRNLFAAHEKQDSPKVDSAEFTFVTGITTDINGVRRVWLLDRMAGKKWMLGEGEEFKVGEASGTVRTIASTSEVIVTFDGKCRRLPIGANLRGGVEVKEPEAAPSHDATEGG